MSDSPRPDGVAAVIDKINDHDASDELIILHVKSYTEFKEVYRAAKECRPEVLKFALLMEKKLRENDHKGGWKGDSAWTLFNRIEDEVNELSDVLSMFNMDSLKIGKECADIGNFAMMICDVSGAFE